MSLIWCCVHVLLQARQSMEKAKAMLEEERQNLSSELKSLQASRTESERGRKRAEGQLQELGARLAQADREREEKEERMHKLQVQMDTSTLSNLICSVTFLCVQIGVALYVLNLTQSHSGSAVKRSFCISLYIHLYPHSVFFSARLSLSPAICPPLTPKHFVSLKRSAAWRASCMMPR